MRAFVFLAKSTGFFITKYLKQEVDDDFVWMSVAPVASLWYKDLLILCGQNNDVTILTGEVPYGLLSISCFYCPNFITVATL